MSEPILRLEELCKDYGEGLVLSGLSLDVYAGEFLTLLGPSGCGKTTTLRIIAGLERPTSGRVLIDGTDVTGLPPEKRPVNTVFQNYALFPHMNVYQNIAYGLKVLGISKSEQKERVTSALSLVRLAGFERRMPSQLSGGQRQRVAIARSVVMLLIIVPFWTNALIRIYGWRILLMSNGPINTLLMNLGLIHEPLKLLYTDGAVLLGMVYALIPFMILPTFTTVDKLDFSVVEAARDLGASPLHAFFTVTVPLTLPGLMAGCVLVFIPSMGLFFLNDLLGGSKSVLAGGLIQQLINSRDLPMAAALSVLLLAVTGAVIAVYRKVGGTGDMSMF